MVSYSLVRKEKLDSTWLNAAQRLRCVLSVASSRISSTVIRWRHRRCHIRQIALVGFSFTKMPCEYRLIAELINIKTPSPAGFRKRYHLNPLANSRVNILASKLDKSKWSFFDITTHPSTSISDEVITVISTWPSMRFQSLQHHYNCCNSIAVALFTGTVTILASQQKLVVACSPFPSHNGWKLSNQIFVGIAKYQF